MPEPQRFKKGEATQLVIDKLMESILLLCEREGFMISPGSEPVCESNHFTLRLSMKHLIVPTGVVPKQ